MNRIWATICLSIIAIASFTPVSLAGPNANAKIQLHLAATTMKNACTVVDAHPACAQINTHGGILNPLTLANVYFCYVLVTDGDPTAGIAEVRFGINYGSSSHDEVGVDIFDWKLCGALEWPSMSPSGPWPESGSGNGVLWTTKYNPELCQRYEPGGPGTGVVATAGYFYCGAYSDAILAITAPPVWGLLDGMAKVIDCSGAEQNIEGGSLTHTPSHLGSVGFGGLPGYSPCGLNTPVENRTWSHVKAMYTER